MARHQNSVDALVHALQFGWASHTVRVAKDCNCTGEEEEEEGTETYQSTPQNKVKKDGRPKCYRYGKPGHLQRDCWVRVQQQRNE